MSPFELPSPEKGPLGLGPGAAGPPELGPPELGPPDRGPPESGPPVSGVSSGPGTSGPGVGVTVGPGTVGPGVGVVVGVGVGVVGPAAVQQRVGGPQRSGGESDGEQREQALAVERLLRWCGDACRFERKPRPLLGDAERFVPNVYISRKDQILHYLQNYIDSL